MYAKWNKNIPEEFKFHIVFSYIIVNRTNKTFSYYKASVKLYNNMIDLSTTARKDIKPKFILNSTMWNGINILYS
jgi:hypothetical protein